VRKLQRWEKIQGWMTQDECEWIARQAAGCRVIVEVGVWKGRSTVCWLEHTPGVVYAVDAWPADGLGCQAYEEIRRDGRESVRRVALANLAPWLASGRCQVLEMRSDQAAAQLVRMLGPAGADLVFLDGDHGQTAVADDVRNYLPLVRPGGLLSGHDHAEVASGLALAGLEVEAGPGSIWWHRVAGQRTA
jgi:predicted O-methyltransferase YrrM